MGNNVKTDLKCLENRELLVLYKETDNDAYKWELVLRMTDYVKRIAVQASGLYSKFTQTDDIVQEGILVLANAVDRFDITMEVKFETYVSKRLRGMIIDLVRKNDWIPRQLRQKVSKIKKSTDELSVKLGRVPTDKEIYEFMGISKEEYDEIISDTAVATLISLDFLSESYGNASGKMFSDDNIKNMPEEAFEEKELHQKLKRGIDSLKENERIVLSLYYDEELTMKEIAEVIGVSSPRVSQIHSRAVRNLKQYLES